MVVRFKLDENIPGGAAALLRAAGHEVQSVVDEHLEGTPDAQLLDACRNESRLLITLDLDFADIRAYPPSGHAGIYGCCGHTLKISKLFSPYCVEQLRFSLGNPLTGAFGSSSTIACGFETTELVEIFLAPAAEFTVIASIG